jgi:hypothetical protein
LRAERANFLLPKIEKKRLPAHHRAGIPRKTKGPAKAARGLHFSVQAKNNNARPETNAKKKRTRMTRIFLIKTSPRDGRAWEDFREKTGTRNPPEKTRRKRPSGKIPGERTPGKKKKGRRQKTEMKNRENSKGGKPKREDPGKAENGKSRRKGNP